MRTSRRSAPPSGGLTDGVASTAPRPPLNGSSVGEAAAEVREGPAVAVSTGDAVAVGDVASSSPQAIERIKRAAKRLKAAMRPRLTIAREYITGIAVIQPLRCSFDSLDRLRRRRGDI